MKALARSCLILLAVSFAQRVASAEKSAESGGLGLLSGQFWSPDHDAKIQFDQVDGTVSGKIVWTQREGLDVHNPDSAKRSRQLIGLQIICGFAPVADGHSWSGGTIYDPDSGNTYHGKMWFDSENSDALQLRGTIMWGIFGRTQSLDRVKPGR